MSMDSEVKHEERCKVLNSEQKKHPSLGQAVLANPWDSVESDTESLAQERVYQKQLQMLIGHHDQIKYIQPRTENTDSLQLGEEEDDNSNDDETEDLQVYDSLDVATHPHAKKNPNLLQTEYLDTQIDDRQETSQQSNDDAYSDLRYDPNWRTNLRGADRFHDNPQISIEEYYQVPKEQSSQSCGDTQELVIKGGYRYIVDTSPSVVMTPHMAGNEFDQPYRLHSPDDQTSSVTSPHNHALQLPSPEADHLKPSCFFNKNESDRALHKGFRNKHENSYDNAGGNIVRSPGLTKDMHAMSIQEFKTYQQQDWRQGGPPGKQQTCTSTISKVPHSKKPERLTEDMVERNKITLGRNTSKCGSYMRVHALKQETSHNVKKVHETPKETTSAESQEDSADPDQMWLQKTQQLKVTQIRDGKKAQRKQHPNPPEQQQHPARGVKAEGGDCLSSPLASPATVTQPDPQTTTSSQPLLPAIHLNILLNTSSNLLPFIQQRDQDDIIELASLHGCPDWSPASEVGLPLSPGCQQANPGKSYQKSQKGVKAHLRNQNLESRPKQWQRTPALEGPVSCEEGDQKWIPNEGYTKQFPQNLPRTPSTPSSLGSGCYTVLPPIRQSLRGAESELSPGQSVKTAYPTHRSSSDGYLVQMEKQKQLRARVTYKAYSLKDYTQLKSDINLRGLGPDYKAIEKTKMKRQKLYSNVIREQNKNIRRIPFLLAKDLEGNDKKVPRIKALEYAKTIAKPPVQCQPKERQKHQSEDFTEHALYLEDLDISQLATLEILRKRHEKEKQAVARLRKVHAV